jgi:hypothetical protein
VFRIVVDAVLFQERQKFLLEIALAMMLGLPLNVCDRVAFLRHTDGKRALSILPGEVCFEFLVHPMGRRAFHELHRLRKRHGCRQRQEHVHMVFRSADYESFEAILAGYAAKKFPKLLLHF